MVAMRAAYETAVETRNYTGLALIDRNDELCVLYEKSHTQEEVLKQGGLDASIIYLCERHTDLSGWSRLVKIAESSQSPEKVAT